MKRKWLATWWNDAKDKQDQRGFDTYEAVMEFKFKTEKKFNRRVQVGLRETSK